MNKSLFCFTTDFIIERLFTAFVGLHKDPKQIASALINKPVPEFYQANLLEPSQIVSPRNFPKKPFLLNVGSWCGYCQQEHPLLMEISKDVPIVGIDYRDKPQNGIAMLERMGNPFILTIDDSRGEFAMQLGVDGAPETYIVDEHGMIRYRHSGYMDRETWLTEIKPKLDELTKSKMKKINPISDRTFTDFRPFAHAEMVDTYAFKNQADRTRAVELAKSLRCPQCQNQNLVESNSPIAYDLRIEVYKMVDEGKTNQQIIDTMTARFGNFVNYKPLSNGILHSSGYYLFCY